MKKKKVGRPPLLYTVYNNKTDMPVIIDGTAEECAKAMGMTLSGFYSAVTHSQSGKIKKWHIDKISVGDITDEY